MLPDFRHQCLGPSDAPWLTFVPGIGNDRHFWSRQAQSLSDRFRVLTFDPWGHGASPPPPEKCGFHDIVAGLVQLWDALSIEQSSLVGLGFGGSVSLATSLDHPNRVNRIVACCCRPRQPDDRREFWRKRSAMAATIGMDRMADITVDRWLDETFRNSNPDADDALRAMFKRTTLAGYQAYVGAFIEMDFADRLADLARPTLLIAGEHDHGGGPVQDMRAMAETIPSARLEIIPSAGHIVNFEAPDKVLQLLNDFLTGRPD
jgi:3-oxoadipate enol-lactonase